MSATGESIQLHSLESHKSTLCRVLKKLGIEGMSKALDSAGMVPGQDVLPPIRKAIAATGIPESLPAPLNEVGVSIRLGRIKEASGEISSHIYVCVGVPPAESFAGVVSSRLG